MIHFTDKVEIRLLKTQEQGVHPVATCGFTMFKIHPSENFPSYWAHDYCQNWLTTWPKFYWQMHHRPSFGYPNFPSNEIPYTNIRRTCLGHNVRWVNTELFMLINYIERYLFGLYIVHQPLSPAIFTPKHKIKLLSWKINSAFSTLPKITTFRRKIKHRRKNGDHWVKMIAIVYCNYDNQIEDRREKKISSIHTWNYRNI